MMMNAIGGLYRTSHITGRSVHNQRIERLWVDVFNQVVDYFSNEFYDLEQNGLLDINDEKNMFALQRVYLKSIENKLDFFKNAWNLHKIRTAGRRTPRQIWLSGMLDNINSNYTAPNEIFTYQADLYSRILNAFETDGLNEPIPQDESVSNLTVTLELSEDVLNQISAIIEQADVKDKDKYLQIAAILNTV